MHFARCLFKGEYVAPRRLRGAQLVSNWIYAAISFCTVLRGALSRIEERHFVDWSETEVAAFAVDGEAHRPTLAPVRVDLKIQAAAVGVPAGINDVF